MGAWMREPASKPWLLLFMAAIVAIGIVMFTENRKRINDLCEVIVLSYSSSSLDGVELTQEQARILGPIFLAISENSAANRTRILAAADCAVDSPVLRELDQ